MPSTKKSKEPVNKTPEVDAYMAQLDHPLKAEAQAVREIIKGVNPAITEQVKWAAPSFSYKGYLVTFNLRNPQHVHLVFHNGVILSNPNGFLEGDYPDRRMAYFTSMQDVKDKQADLVSAIQEWIRLMDQG